MAANTFEDYLEQVIGIPDAETRNEIMASGIYDFDQMRRLPPDEIEKKMQAIRKPGGLIANPHPDAGGAPFIPDPGLPIAGLQQDRLKYLHYYSYYCHIVQRVVQPVNAPDFLATPERLMRIADYYKFDLTKKRKDMEKHQLPPKFDSRNARKTLQSLETFLENQIGQSGAVLSYLVRDDPDPVPEEDDGAPTALDPGWGNPNFRTELIERARHDGPEFESDNQLLAEYMKQLSEDTPVFSMIKIHLKRRDGRAAFLALKDFHMGTAYRATTAERAEHILNTVYYTGTARNFTFSQFLSKFHDALGDKEIAGEPLTDEQKVRKLRKRITDPKLGHALACLMEPQYATDYEAAVQYLKAQHEYEHEDTVPQANRRASQVTSGRGDSRGRGSG